MTRPVEINQRAADDLTPLKTETIPEEIAPFTRALNRLFVRVDETMQREREFTDNAAHELRTPLAAMKMQTQVLEKKLTDRPDCQDDIANLIASVDRATQMVTQLLEFSRLQNLSSSQDQVDLSALIENVLRESTSAANSRNQTIDVAITPNLYVTGHAVALQTLVRNLVDNAIKYSAIRGQIAVWLERKGTAVVLRVSDDGPGIPEEHIDKVFERFYRLHKGHSTGSGLGLSMVRWVADVHHAEIRMQNNRPHGLSVEIGFPAANERSGQMSN